MRFDNLSDWLEWQSTLHVKNIDLGLERVANVWQQLLGKDDFEPFVITVAGTNGKGSSVAMLEAILQAAGYRTGCYTSPHLLDYNERIRVDGRNVSDQDICEAFESIDQARNDISLSYFEFGTLAALQVFRAKQPEVVILEVGLGGRLDAVNIIDADAALITEIAIDHQDWLGDTRDLIGREKAGILRAGQAAVFSGCDIPFSIVEVASRLQVDLKIAGEDFNAIPHQHDWSFVSEKHSRHGLPVPHLRGEHQLRNAAGVIALLLCIQTRLPVQTEALRRGLLNASIPGRFQVLQDLPLPVVVDVAHNQQSMTVLAENLKKFVIKGRLFAIVGMLKDKDIENSFKPMLDVIDSWHFVPTPGQRGQSAEKLAEVLTTLTNDAEIHCHETLAEAWQSVLQSHSDSDSVLVCGSFLVAGDFLNQIRSE